MAVGKIRELESFWCIDIFDIIIFITDYLVSGLVTEGPLTKGLAGFFSAAVGRDSPLCAKLYQRINKLNKSSSQLTNPKLKSLLHSIKFLSFWIVCNQMRVWNLTHMKL